MGDAALGLESGVVRVHPYDARWPVLFEAAVREIRGLSAPGILAIHHVGSTAVPGLCAKPILDLLVSITDFEAGRGLVPPLAGLGYEFRPDEETPDRHYFRRRSGTRRTHHLSLAVPGSRYHVVTLGFRDALRRDPRLALAYSDLKQRLAAQFPRDRAAYIDGKSAFVRQVLWQAGLESA